MSYDLRFARRAAGQSWDDFLEADEDEDPGAAPRPEIWQRIVEHARRLLGDIEAHLTDEYGEIDHEPTGIQLVVSENAGEMHVPYGDTGERAAAVLNAMYLLGRIVEDETGLEGYDPQVDLPVAEAAADLSLGLASFETVAHMLRGRAGGAG